MGIGRCLGEVKKVVFFRDLPVKTYGAGFLVFSPCTRGPTGLGVAGGEGEGRELMFIKHLLCSRQEIRWSPRCWLYHSAQA